MCVVVCNDAARTECLKKLSESHDGQRKFLRLHRIGKYVDDELTWRVAHLHISPHYATIAVAVIRVDPVKIYKPSPDKPSFVDLQMHDTPVIFIGRLIKQE